MDANTAKQILDKVIGQIFGYQNPLSLEQAMQKFAFDLKLPQQVFDSTTGEPTWAHSANPTKFITISNVEKRNPVDDWMLPKRPLNNLQDILTTWNETNFTVTERQIESANVAESDNIYNSENIFRSQDVHMSKNILFCDSIRNCEFTVASQRSNAQSFCIRSEDSSDCSNSFSVIWSGKVSNSFFVQDCYDISDCMFCSHIVGKQYCIANIQFEKEEYMKLREEVIRWILTA